MRRRAACSAWAANSTRSKPAAGKQWLDSRTHADYATGTPPVTAATADTRRPASSTSLTAIAINIERLDAHESPEHRARQLTAFQGYLVTHGYSTPRWWRGKK
jgi:hypothetical protein